MTTMPSATRANSVQGGAWPATSSQPPTPTTTIRAVPASSGPRIRPAPCEAK